MASNNDRGRSPSVGRQHDGIRTSAATSPQPTFDASFSDPNAQYAHALGAQQQQLHDANFAINGQQSANYFLDPTYADFTSANISSKSGQDIGIAAQQGFLPSHGLDPNAAFDQTSSLGNIESSAFPSLEVDPVDFERNGGIDPSLFGDLNADSSALLSSQVGFDDSGISLNPMSTMQSNATTPPHLLPGMGQHRSNSPSPNASPNAQQGVFANTNRGRAVSESLDPSSAMFPQQSNDWSHVGPYRHRHTPSDNYSDVSSHSNQASPYMPNLDNFDANAHASPLLNPSQDPSFNDGLGLGGFSLNDAPLHQHYNPSPGHSPQPSPRLSPQQPLPPFTSENSFGLNPTVDGQFMQPAVNGIDLYQNSGQEPFPGSIDPGQSDAMSPPEINIVHAPPTRTTVDNPRAGHNDEALSPPMRTGSRNRMRAKSDSWTGSRPSSPSVIGRGRSPSLQPTAPDSLTPFDPRGRSASRSPSPSGGSNGTGSGSRGRSASNASDQREYILDLANPERVPSSDGRRPQKHPATFQCTLCPKRFTRAYNLRSHLRTHTDERPFVCTVCGKAFARQHDRKRHEGLHSGEKKFVCRGALQTGAQWGCGRRFARADALGRHFRSEAGRVCIKPLLDEEAAERQKHLMEEQQQHASAGGLMPQQHMMGAAPPMDMMNNFLPAAILQQYPSLAGIDWNALPQGSIAEEDYSGRSSFDASSGGEMYEDMSDGEMMGFQDQQMSGMNNMGMQPGMQNMGIPMQAGNTAVYGASSSGGAGGGVYGNQAGDYLSDFEGR